MYDSPRRRGGRGVAGPRARPVPVASHEGSTADYLRRHEEEAQAVARASLAEKRAFAARLLPRTIDPRNLRRAWDGLASGDGQAPGPDGLHYGDLSSAEVWDMIHALRHSLRDDRYRPGPMRRVMVPKNSGQGTRTLSIPSILDRVVQRAVVQTVQPFLDATFDDASFGYRPGRHRLHALARAERAATTANGWAWVADDLKDAFNHVPQERLLDVVRHRLFGAEIVRLIERLVRSASGTGLPQGSCLSPLLLNLYLDHHLDRPWKKRYPGAPLVRVADDLLVLTTTPEEARQARQNLEQLLQPAGLPLKGTMVTAVRDLSGGETIDWLGYRLRKGKEGLEVEMTERPWRSLEEAFRLAHHHDDAPLRAYDIVVGWISQQGPCLPWTNPQGAYARVKATALSYAFEELPPQGEFLAIWRQAHEDWQRVRREMR